MPRNAVQCRWSCNTWTFHYLDVNQSSGQPAWFRTGLWAHRTCWPADLPTLITPSVCEALHVMRFCLWYAVPERRGWADDADENEHYSAVSWSSTAGVWSKQYRLSQNLLFAESIEWASCSFLEFFRLGWVSWKTACEISGAGFLHRPDAIPVVRPTVWSAWRELKLHACRTTWENLRKFYTGFILSCVTKWRI